MLGRTGPSRYSTELFEAYHNKNYQELSSLLKTLAGLGSQEYLDCKEHGFTLLHHATFEEDNKAFGLVMEHFGTDREVLEHNENKVSRFSCLTLKRFVCRNGGRRSSSRPEAADQTWRSS
jgi:hypothetical protein